MLYGFIINMLFVQYNTSTRHNQKENMLLIINSQRKRAVRLSEALRLMGYLSYPMLPSEIGAKISPQFKAGIIFLDGKIADLGALIRTVRAYNRSLPLFLVGDGEYPKNEILMSLPDDLSGAATVKAIISELQKRELPLPGDYRALGFIASVDSPTVTYFGTPLRLTRSETMILRYLIASYPTPRSAKDILSYAYRQSKLPESGCVRTQLSCMNRKLREASGRAMTEYIPERGYRLISPD